jgi:hypothetical protein
MRHKIQLCYCKNFICFEFFNIFEQRSSIIINFIFGGEQQRERPLACLICNQIHFRGMIVKLFKIFSSEFIPFCRVMPKPVNFSQVGYKNPYTIL